MKKRILALLATAVLGASALCGCGGGVTVNTNGGTLPPTNGEEVEISEIVKTKPEKAGYIFGGWYSDKEMTQLITESTDLSEVDEIYAKWITAEKKTYNVRSDEVTITDSGRKRQQMDAVNLPYDYDYQGLLYAGYTTLEISLTLEAREQDDGYQYVFLYRGQDCVDTGSVVNIISGALFGKDDSDPSLLCGFRFEHGGEGENKNWSSHTFSASISLKDLSEQLYIRYGASGNWGDTWNNRNVVLTVEPK